MVNAKAFEAGFAFLFSSQPHVTSLTVRPEKRRYTRPFGLLA
jgi:hypothetical protein